MALRLYERALQHDPQSLPILRQIIDVARTLNRKSEYMRYALIAVELDPANLRLVFDLADQLQEQNDFDNALKLYSRARTQVADKKSSLYLSLTVQCGRLSYVLDRMPQAAAAFAEVMAALEKPAEFGLDAAARKAILGDDVKSYELFADAFLQADRMDDAQKAFDKVQQLAPNAALFALHRAQVLTRKKDYEQALKQLQVYFDAKENREKLTPYELLEQVLDGLGRKKELLTKLETIRQTDPNNIFLGYFVAQQYLAAEQWAKAAPVYQELLKRSPNVEAYRGLIQVYRHTRQTGALLDTLAAAVENTGGLEILDKEVVRIAQDNALLTSLIRAAQERQQAGRGNYGTQLSVALLAMQGKLFDFAGEFFNLALASRPKVAAELLLTWGSGLLTAEQYPLAAQVFQRGIDQRVLPADNPLLYSYLAVALEMAGKTTEALVAAGKASELGQDSPRLESRMAWVFYHAKRYPEAAEAYRRLIKKYDGESKSEEVRRALKEFRTILSNIAVHQNDVPQAEEWLEQVLDEYPDDISALNDLGYLWADEGKNLKRALEMVQRAVEAEPDNYAYRDSLGWVYFRLGRHEEAVAELEKAAAVPDPDGVVLDHLGDAYQACQQLDKARDIWQRAVTALKKQEEPDKAQAVEAKLQKINDE
jgi:tetratricopeptide (TPR) repeat protein